MERADIAGVMGSLMADYDIRAALATHGLSPEIILFDRTDRPDGLALGARPEDFDLEGRQEVRALTDDLMLDTPDQIARIKEILGERETQRKLAREDRGPDPVEPIRYEDTGRQREALEDRDCSPSLKRMLRTARRRR